MTTPGIQSLCPNCGFAASREPYDIGSGPELACASCEWCWGADGQPLQPLSRQPFTTCPQCGVEKVDANLYRARCASCGWAMLELKP